MHSLHNKLILTNALSETICRYCSKFLSFLFQLCIIPNTCLIYEPWKTVILQLHEYRRKIKQPSRGIFRSLINSNFLPVARNLKNSHTRRTRRPCRFKKWSVTPDQRYLRTRHSIHTDYLYRFRMIQITKVEFAVHDVFIR